ncbi:MAG: AsmA-like C-terminal region-containing protein [Steroidobacteraceae bacterium]
MESIPSRRRLWRRVGWAALAAAALAATAVMLGRVVVARVPQQRAVIERLFEQRTGLEVRFASMRVGWGWRGVRAVLTRVELAEPRGRRFRANAPEVQLNLDTWGIFRGGELSLGRVILLAPEIEVITAREPADADGPSATAAPEVPRRDAAPWLARLVETVRAMPRGRFDVEAGTLRIVDSRAGSARIMKVSQLVVRRDEDAVSGYGSVLLPELIGRSLFVSIELDGINTRPAAVTGELRVIGRRLALEEIAGGRGAQGLVTLDARATVQAGALTNGRWQANLRRVAFVPGEPERALTTVTDWRFERIDMSGQLRRVSDRLRVDVDNFYVAPTAGPGATAALAIDFDEQAAAAVVRSARLPMPVARFLAAVAARGAPRDWPLELDRTSGELQQLTLRWSDIDAAEARFDFRADARGLTSALPGLKLSVSDLSGVVRGSPGRWQFEPASNQPVTITRAAGPDDVETAAGEVATLAGRVTVTRGQAAATNVLLEDLVVTAARSVLRIAGSVSLAPAGPVAIDATTERADAVATLAALEHLAPDSTLVRALQPLRAGRLSQATLHLRGIRDAEGGVVVDTAATSLDAQIDALAWEASELQARLRDARGTLALADGRLTFVLTGGRVEDIELETARLELPTDGPGRAVVRARAPLESAWLAQRWPALAALNGQGAAQFELQTTIDPGTTTAGVWRGVARVIDASVLLATPLPPVTRLRGTLEFADRRLTSSTLMGGWFGGSLQLEVAQQTVDETLPTLNLRGVATVEALAQSLGIADSSQLAGEITWTGTFEPARAEQPPVLLVETSLTGLTSTLPSPYAKPAGRALPVALQVSLGAEAAVWELSANQRRVLRATTGADQLQLQLDLPGVVGVVTRNSAELGEFGVVLDTVEVARLPALVSAARAVAAAATTRVVDVRVAAAMLGERSLGPVQANLHIERGGVELVSASLPQLWREGDVRGRCADMCQLSWRVVADPAKPVLQLLGLAASLDAKRFTTDGKLTWPAEQTPGVATMTGEVAATVLDGLIVAQPVATAPMAWLAPAIVSSADLAAATVDIADFSSLASALSVDAGSATLDRWVLRGAQGELAARGRIDLVRREYDLDLDWQPLAGAPSEAGDTAERSRLAAAWAALRSRLQRDAQLAAPSPASLPPMAFRMVGPWDAPLLARLPTGE